MTATTPRKSVEPSYAAQLANDIRDIRTRLASLERGASLRNAAISGGDGLKVYGPDGDLRISLNTSDGAVVAYDANEQAVARYGPLVESAPGEYGVEILVAGDWIRLGYQTTGWAQLGGKPAWAADTASVPGSYISGDVPSATHAAAASLADGSQYGFNNTVAGTEFYALWVGNDGGFHFGRNTSSIRYKENVSTADIDPKAVLGLRPVIYDRKAQLRYPTDEEGNRLEGPPVEVPGVKGEFGLIAEEVAEVLPQAVTYFEGQIDGVRYDLIGPALVPLLQWQESRIATLEETQRAQAAQIEALTRAVTALGGTV